MKRFISAIVFCLTIGIVPVWAQGNTNDFWTDIGLAASAFKNGAVTNLDVRPGVTYIQGKDISDRLGGSLKFGYNLPTMGEASFAPWLEPMLGGYYLNNSYYTFNGSIQFKSAWYVFRLWDKDSKSLWYNVAIIPNVEAGVVDNVSGTQWGNFTVPGKKAISGQSVGALYGPGVEIDMPWHSWAFGLAYEHTEVTTLQGATINEFNLKFQKKF